MMMRVDPRRCCTEGEYKNRQSSFVLMLHHVIWSFREKCAAIRSIGEFILCEKRWKSRTAAQDRFHVNAS